MWPGNIYCKYNSLFIYILPLKQREMNCNINKTNTILICCFGGSPRLPTHSTIRWMTHRTAYSCPCRVGLSQQRVHRPARKKRQGQNLDKYAQASEALATPSLGRDTWAFSFLQYKNCSLTRAVLPCREADYRDPAATVLTGGWSQRQPLPSSYQNSWSPEGNQMFTINHSIYTNNLCDLTAQNPGVQSLSDWGLLSSFFLRANPEFSLETAVSELQG